MWIVDSFLDGQFDLILHGTVKHLLDRQFYEIGVIDTDLSVPLCCGSCLRSHAWRVLRMIITASNGIHKLFPHALGHQTILDALMSCYVLVPLKLVPVFNEYVVHRHVSSDSFGVLLRARIS